MLLLPFQVSQSTYRLMVVLDDEGLSRVTEHDPADVVIENLGDLWANLKLISVHVTYANPADMIQIESFRQARDNRGLIRYLRRGDRWATERGDHETNHYRRPGR